MKVIVFGGSGFLGSHVADILTEKGYEVVVYDRLESAFLNQMQRIIVGDILDYEKVREAVAGMDYVYHFAGIADIQEAQEKPIDTVRYNILATTYLLDACREFKIKRFLYASSIYVYGEQGSFYRASKQASELLIETYHSVYGLNYTILRYGSLYGKRSNQFNFINRVILQALREKRIQRKGNGNEIRDYINVLDAARASVEILEKNFENSHVMITGNQTMRIRDFLEMIKEMLDNEITIEYTNEREEAHYEITPYSFRPKVARKYLLNSYHDLGQGILECIYDAYQKISKEGSSESG